MSVFDKKEVAVHSVQRGDCLITEEVFGWHTVTHSVEQPVGDTVLPRVLVDIYPHRPDQREVKHDPFVFGSGAASGWSPTDLLNGTTAGLPVRESMGIIVATVEDVGRRRAPRWLRRWYADSSQNAAGRHKV